MANNLKENPIGLDAVIHNVQKELYNDLSVKWGIQLDGYPRCYTNYNENKADIQYYKKNNEYESVLHAERNKFFFTAEEDVTRTGNYFYTTSIKLYFIVDLKKIKNIPHRADEEIINDVVNVLETNSKIVINRITRNKRNIFNSQTYSDKDNLEPYFVCMFDLNVVEYNINQLTCN